jgi:hypothetical protein
MNVHLYRRQPIGIYRWLRSFRDEGYAQLTIMVNIKSIPLNRVFAQFDKLSI